MLKIRLEEFTSPDLSNCYENRHCIITEACMLQKTAKLIWDARQFFVQRGTRLEIPLWLANHGSRIVFIFLKDSLASSVDEVSGLTYYLLISGNFKIITVSLAFFFHLPFQRIILSTEEVL